MIAVPRKKYDDWHKTRLVPLVTKVMVSSIILKDAKLMATRLIPRGCGDPTDATTLPHFNLSSVVLEMK